jgi:hypothetical protein
MNFWVPQNAERLTVGFTRRTQLYGVKFVMGEECERGDEPPGSIKCWEVLE